MRSPKGKKKSFSPICVPKTGKCSVQAQGFSLHSHPSQVAGLNHPYFTQHPGAPFPIAQHHSPSVTAVPTEQGVQRALQEIEVPFGNQRPQRKHVTLMDTLWAQVPTLHVWTYVYGPYQIDALWIPLPLLYVQPQVSRSLGRYTAGSSAPSGISSVPSVVVQSEYSRGTERLEERVCVCMGLPCTCTGSLTEG